MSQVDPLNPAGDLPEGPQNGSNGHNAAHGNGSGNGSGPNGNGQGGVLATLDHATNGVPSLGWNHGLPMRPEILSAKPNPVSLLHAVRRRWPLAIGLGTALALASMAAVWFLVPVKYEVAAMLRVSGRPPRVLKDGGADQEAFDLYKRTQSELIRSNVVVGAVSRDPTILRLSTLQEHSDDQVQWLRGQLMVDNPSDSEILRVAMRGEHPADLVAIVNLVIEKYLDEVVYRDRRERVVSQGKIREYYDRTLTDYKNLNKQVHDLKIFNKVESTDAAQIAKQLLNSRFQDALHRSNYFTSEMAKIERKLSLAEKRKQDPDSMRPPDVLIEQEVNKDPHITVWNNQKFQLEEALSSVLYKNKDKENYKTGQIRKDIEFVNDKLEAKKSEVRAQIIANLGELAATGGGQSIVELKAEFAELSKQRENADKEIEDIATEVGKLDTFSQDVASKQDELLAQGKIIAELRGELDRITVEQQAPSRIQKLDDATLTTPRGDAMRKYIGMGFAGLLGFSLVVIAIGFIEVQSRRVNASHEVSDGLGIRIVGELPNLSPRVLKGAKGGNGAAVLKALIAERIDGARTALIHTTTIESPRVVMVTSAEGGEGKTTTATQLAASLARSGRRTLIIDADIRNGTVHQVFDLLGEPGLCELLRGEVDREGVVQPTRTPNLWLVSAGRCDLKSVQCLSAPALGLALSAFAAQYDYVVIDAGPVLKVADPLLVGQHVDAAIVSVLRDVSKVPKVYEACERLRAVGITVLGSVVNGVNDDVARHGVELLMAEMT